MKNIIITHVTTVHPRNDTRIFLKQCISLAKENLNVKFIVADGLGNDIKNDIEIFDVVNKLKHRNRFQRILFYPFLVLKKIIVLKPDLIHFHDPELILLGIFLKRIGYKVIYDIHEDVESDIKTKYYIPNSLKVPITKIFKILENYGAKIFNGLITATPHIFSLFNNLNSRIININNYPIIDEFNNNDKKSNQRNEIVYLGGISRIRGLKFIVESLEKTKCKLNLVGEFKEPKFKNELVQMNQWEKVNFFGFCDRKKSSLILSESFAGIVTFLDAPNHTFAQPNKLFEYMSSGIPVIASNFSLWKEIVEGNQCGICVDPVNIDEIVSAINYLYCNPQKAKSMGQNGKRAILETYNWDSESKKLIEFYRKILSE